MTRYATKRLPEEDPAPSKRARPPAYLRQVGRRLRVARPGLGRSAADICRELGTTDRAWSQGETGKRLLDVLVAIRLKERYGITLDWLYDGDPARLPLDLAAWARSGAAAEPDLAAPRSAGTPAVKARL
ncbi:MAG: helix-turn-helix transcriptional regulator [Rhodospirillaceae bacterium]|nr:helix-turn-helix transcriptional regulator [Rhodospirillaceae bacterium]